MALTEIEANSLADSSIINGNFQYLESLITALALRVSTCETNIGTNANDISSLETRVTALEER